MVLREALLLVGTGIALGFPVCYGGVRGISSLLYGIAPVPIIPLLVSTVVLCSVAGAAALIPAHRAGSVDPVVALRNE